MYEWHLYVALFQAGTLTKHEFHCNSHSYEMWLTRLPFSGLHLHPPLQSWPAQGSLGSAPCRHKKTSRILQTMLSDHVRWIFCASPDILMLEKSPAHVKKLVNKSHFSCRAWGTAATERESLFEIPSWMKEEQKQTRRQKNRSRRAETSVTTRSHGCESCISANLADLQRFKRGKGIWTGFKKGSDPVGAETGCWLKKCKIVLEPRSNYASNITCATAYCSYKQCFCAGLTVCLWPLFASCSALFLQQQFPRRQMGQSFTTNPSPQAPFFEIQTSFDYNQSQVSE